MSISKPFITQIWAHRGASTIFLENTLQAFEEAIRQGAEGIELDVQLSKDGEIIVFHDESLARLSNRKDFVRDLTARELQEISLVHPQNRHLKGKIPLLADVLAIVKESPLLLNIELKNSYYLYEGLESKVIRLIKDFQMEEQVVLSSFNHGSIRKLAEYMPREKLGILSANLAYRPWDYVDRCGAGLYHPMLNNLYNQELVPECHARKIKVNMWTLDEPLYIKAALQAGVDAIITNLPDQALKIRDEYIRDTPGGK